VLATENPIEQDGTYPLPEAQLDRFMFKLSLGFPSAKEIVDIVNMTQTTMDEISQPVIGGEELLRMRGTAKEIPIIDEVLEYAAALVAATHPELPDCPEMTKKYIRFGASPRAAQSLVTGGKVRALIEGRFNVSFEDINVLAYPVLRHRIKLNYEAISGKITADDVIKEIISGMKKIKK